MRDDIRKLPLSKSAKAYARRSGLKAMRRQPDQFMAVNAKLTNPGKPNKFKSYDAGQPTSGKLKRSESKNNARFVVEMLLIQGQ